MAGAAVRSTERLKSFDWLTIAGRGTVVSVDVAQTNGIKSGDTVQFQDRDTLYQVMGIEESRCLVAHGHDRQCVMYRGLVVREVKQ